MSVFEVLKQVLTSWQVIVIAIAIIAYIQLVSYVSRRYHRPRSFGIKNSIKKVNPFKKKAAQPAAAAAEGPEEALSGSSANDELGLEEA